eukprot:6460469-Amphidinium_carterae.1
MEIDSPEYNALMTHLTRDYRRCPLGTRSTTLVVKQATQTVSTKFYHLKCGQRWTHSYPLIGQIAIRKQTRLGGQSRTSNKRSALVGPVTIFHGDLALTSLAAAAMSASHRHCASNSLLQAHSPALDLK